MRRPHSVDLYDHKAKLRHAVQVVQEAKGLGHKCTLWSRVDLLDDGIIASGIEVGRPHDDAIDIRFAVTTLGDKTLRWTPAGIAKSAPIGSLQFAYQTAVLAVTQLGHDRLVYA